MGNDWIGRDDDDAADAAADAEYRAVLREVSGAAPVDRVHWDAFHARVEHAAEAALAGRRRHDEGRHIAWWEYTARGRVTIPIALAASLVLAAYVGLQSTDGAGVSAPAAVSPVSTGDVRDAFEASVTGAVPSRRVAVLLVSSPADADAPGTDDTTQ